jgi:hypothetical protein
MSMSEADRTPAASRASAATGSVGDRLGNWLVGVGAAAIIFIPYFTITMPYRRALVTQADLILLVTLVLFVCGLARPGRIGRILAAPRPVLLGLVLYSAAAILGTIVALVRGNDHTLIAGQLLSMGLLPLAAVAGLMLGGGQTWRGFALGIVGATAVASALHLGYWLYTGVRGVYWWRMIFDNGITATGAGIVALPIALAFALWGERRIRGASWLATAVILFLVVGTQTRSLWLATAAELVALVLMAEGPRAFFRPQVLKAAAVALALVVLASAGTYLWWTVPRRNLVPRLDAGSRAAAAPTWRLPEDAQPLDVAPGIPLPGRGEYRLTAEIKGDPAVKACIWLMWLDRNGTTTDGAHTCNELGESWTTLVLLVRAPQDAQKARLQISVDAPKHGAFLARKLTLEHLGSPLVGMLGTQAYELAQRLGTMIPGAPAGTRMQDSDISDRFRESRVLLSLFASSSWPERITGRGLGARFDFQGMGVDDEGHIVATASSNYIHNYYMFLLVKLGCLGALAALVALWLWIRQSLAFRRRILPGSGRTFHVAAVSAWVGGCCWSLACPELLDFRVAPLWGLLLVAVMSTTDAGSPQAPGPRRGVELPTTP